MKTKHIIFLGIFLIITILYFYLFTGANEFESYCVDNYDGHSNVLQLPIVKYKKGFLNYTFYTCTTIENEACEIRFAIDYINKTIIFDDYEKLNERIKMLQKDYARPVAQQYAYLDINDESYFNNIIEYGINVRLIDPIENNQDRQIIINLSTQTLKMRL